MYLYELSGEDLKLAQEEIRSLIGAEGKLDRNLLLSDSYKKGLVGRLAYTKAVYRVLFSCSPGRFRTKFWQFNWAPSYQRSFCLRLHNKKYSEEDYASMIWNSLKNNGIKPRVNLTKPGTKYEVFFGRKVYACVLVAEVQGDFESRKAHKLAKLHPTALHPKLARAMVNLSGVKKGGIVHDPFCGSGGILIETGLMGIKGKGYDKNNSVLVKCKRNLNKLRIRDYKLYYGDSLKLKRKMNYIVSDLPYGLNTKNISKDFFDQVFKMLHKTLGVRAVIGVPDKLRYKSLLKKNGLKELFSTTVYLHKKLSKRIIVVESF